MSTTQTQSILHPPSSIKLYGAIPTLDHMNKAEIIRFLHFLGKNYPGCHVKLLTNGYYVFAHRLLMHWTVKSAAIGDYFGYEDRYCLQTEDLAVEALKAWDDTTKDCPGRWHRHPITGRRREWKEDGTYREYIHH